MASGSVIETKSRPAMSVRDGDLIPRASQRPTALRTGIVREDPVGNERGPLPG
jgi:hypothetical protein